MNQTYYSQNGHTSRILIVGAGVVGTATGTGLSKKGFHVSYVDIKPETIARLRSQGFRATTAAQVNWDEVDIVMLTVSTPTVGGRISLDYIASAARDVGRGLATTSNFATVVVRSTVPPTTTERCLTPILEQASGKQAGIDFGIAMNPEFLRQKHAVQDFDRPWLTVLGVSDPRTAETLKAVYAPFGGLIIYCTPTEAEMIKYVNNIYNAVKISYFNEVHQICEQLGIDSNVVGAVVARSAESMWNPLYGIRGGVPYGGACLPKDAAAFLAFCRDNGWEHLMLESAIETNRRLEASIPAAESPDQIGDILGLTITPKLDRSTAGLPLLNGASRPAAFKDGDATISA
ncbi:MAG TPA: nucleotide sugar dehydrogenase [Anaerolineae bacterium]